MPRIHAFVKGRVQGVTFRASTRRKARKLNVTGYVRNQTDGSVEVVAEGDNDAIQALVEYLRQGPPRARVDSVQVEREEKEEGFDTFSIRY